MPSRNSDDSFGVYFGQTGLTLTTQLSKAGGAFATVAPSQRDDGNGWYTIMPLAAHRDTVGKNNWLFTPDTGDAMPYTEEVVSVSAETGDHILTVPVLDNLGSAVNGARVTLQTPTGVSLAGLTDITKNGGVVQFNVSAADSFQAIVDTDRI